MPRALARVPSLVPDSAEVLSAILREVLALRSDVAAMRAPARPLERARLGGTRDTGTLGLGQYSRLLDWST